MLDGGRFECVVIAVLALFIFVAIRGAAPDAHRPERPRWLPIAAIVISATLALVGRDPIARFMSAAFWISWIVWRVRQVDPGPPPDPIQRVRDDQVGIT
jgi:hypothetical protein